MTPRQFGPTMRIAPRASENLFFQRHAFRTGFPEARADDDRAGDSLLTQS